MMSQITRPILRYHGGKWRLAPWIISHFPPHEIYVEPFGGAASVLLRKEKSRIEVYNDIDEKIVNLFRLLRSSEETRRLCDQLRLTPFSRLEYDQACLHNDDPIEEARRLFVRSFQGFGATGILDSRHKAGFRAANVRSLNQDTQRWNKLPESLLLVVHRMKDVIIECRDALQVISQQDDHNTLFYIDPPYLESTRNSSGKQYRFEMGITQHYDLARMLLAAKGKIIVSGYPSDLYDKVLYSNWHRIERGVSASGQRGGVSRTEVLWMNFDPGPREKGTK